MKYIKHILLSTGLGAGLMAANSGFSADDPSTNQPAPGAPNPPAQAQPPPDAPAADEQTVPQPAAQTPPAANTPPANAPAVVTPAVAPAAGSTNASSVDDKGMIRFNFKNTRLDQILDFMSSAAGYIIMPNRNVDLSTKVTVWSDQPVTRDESLTLLKQVMAQNGYQIISNPPDDRTLSIVSTLEVKHLDIPVVLFHGSSSDIPRSPDVMTYIIPVRSLNAVQLIRDLQPLLPTDTTITANESGNSLVMTASQINVRRVVEIVKALDSVSSSSSTITVFPLKFADAKTLASLIKDLFPSADASSRGGGFGNPFATMFGGRGGGGGGGRGAGGDTGDSGNGHTPTTRITAVADDRSNSLAVSSPDEMVPTITELINQLDTNVQDLTEMRAFKLKNADPVETADMLTKLFPDPTKSDDTSGFSSGRQMRFGGFPGMGGQNNSSGGSSDRTKKVNQVTAVADARTGSVVVTAGKDLMPQIASLIDTLDVDPAGKKHAFVIDLKSADPTSVLQVLQDAFPSQSRTGSSATQTSVLQTRQTTLQQQQNSSTSATSTSFGSTPGGR